MYHRHSVQQCLRQSELRLREELSNIRAPHPSKKILLLTLDAGGKAAAGWGLGQKQRAHVQSEV
jgi:hypothetical protein